MQVAMFDKYSEFRLVKIKPGLENGRHYNGVYCNKTMEKQSRNRDIMLLYYDEDERKYRDISGSHYCWNDSMFDDFTPKAGATVKISNSLYNDSDDFPFGVNYEMSNLSGTRVVITSVSVYEDRKYNCQFRIKIKQDGGDNTWSTPMFDWSTYQYDEDDEDIDFHRNDFVTLRDDIVFGEYYKNKYVSNYLEELKGMIFKIGSIYDDDTMSLKTYDNEYLYDDIDTDYIHGRLFRKINKDSIEKLNYGDSYINEDTQYVKYSTVYDKDKEYIFTTDDENYRLLNLTDEEKEFLASISEGDIFKVRQYLPEEKNEADYIIVSKVGDKSFEVSHTICDMFFEEYEPDAYWHFTDDDENEVDITCPVKLHEQVKLGEFYDCNGKILYASDYFKDIIGQTLKVTSAITEKDDLKTVKCKIMLMGDAVGDTYTVPLGLLVNTEKEELEELNAPNLKPGNLAVVKKGLILGKKYKNKLTGSIAECESPFDDCHLDFCVVRSNFDTTEYQIENEDGSKDSMIFTAPTMFLNLAVRKKQKTPTGVIVFNKEEFEPTDYIVLKDEVVNGMNYVTRGKIKVLEDYKDVEQYRGKVMLFSDCQDDGEGIRFYHNGCIHCMDKDLFKKVNKNGKNINKERGNVVMKNLGLGNVINKMFGEVGVVSDGSLALTLTGKVAVKRNDGDYVRYDEVNEVMENQGELIFPGSEKFMMLMPSATVAVGDIIKKDKKYYQVLEIKANGGLKAVDFATGHNANILKETNLFNMNFYTKVVSFMTGFNGDNGNGMNPMMMLLLTQNDEDKEMDLPTMIMISSMFGGQAQTGMNPMMMLLMLKDDDGESKSNIVETIMMASMIGGMNGGTNPFASMFGQQQIAAPVIEQDKNEKVEDSPEVAQLKEIIASQSKALENALKELAKFRNDKTEVKDESDSKDSAKKSK